MKRSLLMFFAVLLFLTSCVSGVEAAAYGTMDENMKIRVDINGKTYSATLCDNPSAKAFYEKLQKGQVSVSMEDYGGFEKVGSLGFSLVRTDRSITTKRGDIVLYMGNTITIYYGRNSWNFTLLGRMDDDSFPSAFNDRTEWVVFSIPE